MPSPENGKEDLRVLAECFERLQDKILVLARRLGWSVSNPTLTTVALANQTYLKLCEDRVDWAAKPEEEIIAIFVKAMREILIDASRRKKAQKRQMAAPPIAHKLPEEDALAVVIAVEDLERAEPRQARIVELRFVLGMTAAEVAIALDVPLRTVEREWERARAFLKMKLQPA